MRRCELLFNSSGAVWVSSKSREQEQEGSGGDVRAWRVLREVLVSGLVWVDLQ